MDKTSKFHLHTGRQMPVLGLGTWQLTMNTAETILYALELGYRLIDTSSDYGTQSGIGEAIKRSDVNREDIYVVAKAEETDDSYARTESNLRELALEYIDFMLIHRPPIMGAGVDLWQGLIRAQKEGLVRDIGVSNYKIEFIDELIENTGVVPTVNQIEWSPFGWSQEMERYCHNKNIIIQAYSPLTRAKRLGDKTLDKIADKYGKSPAQILMRWNLQHHICPIPKANQRKHLEENINVFDFEIDQDDMIVLDDLNEQYSTFGSLPYI